MEKEVKKYKVMVPEDCFLEVMRQLNTRSMRITETCREESDGEVYCGAIFTSPSMWGFKEWLNNTTNGSGEFTCLSGEE